MTSFVREKDLFRVCFTGVRPGNRTFSAMWQFAVLTFGKGAY